MEETTTIRQPLVKYLPGLRPYQTEGVKFELRVERGWLADDPGLGKTHQGIGLLYAAEPYPVVISCPKAAKGVWEDHCASLLPDKNVLVLSHLPSKSTVNYLLAQLGVTAVKFEEEQPVEDTSQVSLNLDWITDDSVTVPFVPIKPRTLKRKVNGTTSRKVDALAKALLLRPDIVILNHDILHAWAPVLVALGIKCVLFDEFHKFKGMKSRRTKAALGLVRGTIALPLPAGSDKKKRAKNVKAGQPVRYRIGLTATPIMNRPGELIPQLEILGRLQEMGGYFHFVQRYCGAQNNKFGMDISRATNTTELHERLKSYMLRRTTDEVMPDLPPIQFAVVPVELDNRAEYDKAEEELLEWIWEYAVHEEEFLKTIAHLSPEEQQRKKYEYGNSKEEKALKAERLVKMNVLRQLAAKGKLTVAKDFIEDFLENEKKLIIFAHHRVIQHKIAEALPGCAQIKGGDSDAVRRHAEKQFQTNPKVLPIVLSLGAASEAITLTAAHHELFLELAWSPETLKQAMGRAYGRANDPHGVIAYYMLARDTIDYDMWRMLEEKRNMIGEIMSGKAPTTHINILEEVYEIYRQKALARKRAA
jgi:SNF2 family DNA or RNA helicase